MSENIDPRVANISDTLPELLKLDKNIDKSEKSPNKSNQNNQANIFDLINHLSEGSPQSQSQNKSVLSSTPTDSQSQLGSDSTSANNSEQIDLILTAIEPIQVCSDNLDPDLETSQSSANTSLDNEHAINKCSHALMVPPRTRIPVGIPRPKLSSTTNQNVTTCNQKSSPTNTSVGTKIPRIAVYSRPKPETTSLLSIRSPVVNNSSQSRLPMSKKTQNSLCESTPTLTPTQQLLTIKSQSRTSPRSFSRDVMCSSSSTMKQKTLENSQTKRGSSLAAGSNSLNSSFSGDSEPRKTKKSVRYAVRHKPRESKVKIFSQKVEIKNVSSKIRSLENSSHKPAGGDVVIETHPVNWQAQSKINSLDKAATYVPNGGNVKIESHKLNWKASAKIGSLEKAATYVPHGGNVKIESRKLNFKAKARPKTDTGLIYMEEVEEDENLMDNSSHCMSACDNLNDTQGYSS